MTNNETPPSDGSLLDILGDSAMRPVLEHWIAIRGDRAMPRRSELDPVAFPVALPHVWIYRRDDAGDYHCELSGEQINAAFKTSTMGKPAAEILGPDEYEQVKRRFEFILDHPAITYSRTGTEEADGHRASRLSMPLADNADIPRFVFGITEYRAVRIGRWGKAGIAARWGRVFDARTLAPVQSHGLYEL